jgi:hypothetical protein
MQLGYILSINGSSSTRGASSCLPGGAPDGAPGPWPQSVGAGNGSGAVGSGSGG